MIGIRRRILQWYKVILISPGGGEVGMWGLRDWQALML